MHCCVPVDAVILCRIEKLCQFAGLGWISGSLDKGVTHHVFRLPVCLAGNPVHYVSRAASSCNTSGGVCEEEPQLWV